MIPEVLSRIAFSVLSNKVSQDLTFLRRMSRDMNETCFWLSCQVIYISFSALASALSRRGVSLIRGRFSSLITSVTRTVGIFPGRFLIRRFYYTFVNRFCNFHTLKHIKTGSRPRCPLRSHSLVRIKNHLFIIGLWLILNKELEFIYLFEHSDSTYIYT